MDSAADLRTQSADNSLIEEFEGERLKNFILGIVVALLVIAAAIGFVYFFGAMVTFG